MWKRWLRKDRTSEGNRPLSWRWVAVYAGMALLIGAGVIWWAWPPDLKSKAEQAQGEVDAIRTGLAAAGGAGAAFTLLLAVRRQRTIEEMNVVTRHDAQQQRMTELYTAAAEQLGYERAAVRLAGLYALQRLGQSYSEQRRPIVNVWCAYLRMPFHDPDADDLDEEQRAQRHQELEVRLTAQRLLREHAHSGPWKDEPASPQYWDDELNVDLTGATLYQFDLGHCRIHPHTTFERTHFLHHTSFDGAQFGDRTSFDGARFDDTSFTRAQFGNHTSFTRARFGNQTSFTWAQFGDHTSFFMTQTSFFMAQFGDYTSFTGARFGDNALFSGVWAPCRYGHVWPEGWELQPTEDGSIPDGGEPEIVWGRLVPVPDSEAETGAGTA